MKKITAIWIWHCRGGGAGGGGAGGGGGTKRMQCLWELTSFAYGARGKTM